MARQTVGNRSETVTVACKLPHGLWLRVFDMVSTQQPVMGGGFQEVKVARERPEQFAINGNAHAQNMAPKSPLAGGYALTHGVPKELWDRWLSENKDSDMVQNNLIFAHSSSTHVQDEAEEKADVRTGLERLDPNRLPKGLEKFSEKAV